MSSAEPEPTTSATPENEPFSSTAEFEPEPVVAEPEPGWPEPEPEWSVAFEEWGAAWPVHTYFFGCAFLIADILAICFLFRVIKGHNRQQKGSLSGSLLVMLILFCSLRFVCLIVDPYHTENILPRLCSRLLWSLGSPFLLSAFSLVLLALIDTTKMSIGPPRFQKLPVILGFTGFYVLLVISTDLAVFFAPETDPLLVVCQGLFIVFGCLMCVGYLYVGLSITYHVATLLMCLLPTQEGIGSATIPTHQKTQSQISPGLSELSRCFRGPPRAVAVSRTLTRTAQDSALTATRHGDSGILRLLVTCYVSSAIGFSIIATHIYASSSVFGVYSDVIFVDAWSWWALQTLMRSEELAEVIVVICVAKRSILPKDALKRLASCLICRKKNSVRKIQILPLDDTFEQTKTINTENLSTCVETKR